MDRLKWTALEYEEKEHDPDWYWALGIIVVTSSITAIIFENYFFSLLLLLGGGLLWVFSKKKPELVEYEINARGVKIASDLYPFDKIKSFWVEQSHPEFIENKDLLYIHTERIFMPILVIPIDEAMTQTIHEIFLSQGIAEEEMHEHISGKILNLLGF